MIVKKKRKKKKILIGESVHLYPNFKKEKNMANMMIDMKCTTTPKPQVNS